MKKEVGVLAVSAKPRRILFTAYAPVHFVCFRPIYNRLKRHPEVEVYFSGGVRREASARKGEASSYDAEGLYRRFRIPADRVLSLGEIRRRSFDMTFSAHVSGFFPRRDKARVQIFHGLSFRNVAVRRDVLVYDFLFILGPYMMRAFHRKQILRPGDPRCIKVGFPKVDRLVDGSLDRKKILKRIGFSGKRPVVLYAPTGQKYNSLDKMGEEVIKRLRKENRYDLLIKPHDHPKNSSINWFVRLRKFQDEHTRIVRDPDVVPYLFVSDLLLTDASSVSNEYSLLDRPMVFIDVPELLEAARKKGQSVDLLTWGRRGGITVTWPDEVVDAVRWALDHPLHGSDVRREMAKDLFYNPGHAAAVAAEWILDWLGVGGRSVGRCGRKERD